MLVSTLLPVESCIILIESSLVCNICRYMECVVIGDMKMFMVLVFAELDLGKVFVAKLCKSQQV